MSVVSLHLNIGSFNIKINVDKDIKIRNNNISRNYSHEKRINEAIEKTKDIRSNYVFLYNLY